MGSKGGQIGNNNAGKNKPFAQAIERALKKRSKVEGAADLLAIAETLLDMAAGGDIQAIKEIADRTDGKSKQTVDVAATVQVDSIERTIVKPKNTNS